MIVEIDYHTTTRIEADDFKQARKMFKENYNGIPTSFCEIIPLTVMGDFATIYQRGEVKPVIGISDTGLPVFDDDKFKNEYGTITLL